MALVALAGLVEIAPWWPTAGGEGSDLPVRLSGLRCGLEAHGRDCGDRIDQVDHPAAHKRWHREAAVNAARRSEQKLGKLQKELQQKGQAWDSWVLEMRAKYAKEHTRHRAEQARLVQEIKELEAQTQAAYLQVQASALQQQVPKEAVAAPPPLEWESEMDIDDELTEEQTRVELARILGRSGAAGKDVPTTPPRHPGTAPRSPAYGPGPPGLAPDPTPLRVATDVYPSPSGSAGENGGPDAWPGVPDPRAPLHARETPHGQSSLAGKLSDKRRAYRSAMGPFGLTRMAPEDSGAVAPATGPQTKPDAGQHFIDDDNEELHAAASPGFGNME